MTGSVQGSSRKMLSWDENRILTPYPVLRMETVLGRLHLVERMIELGVAPGGVGRDC